MITHNPTLEPFATREADGNWLAGDGPLIYQTTFAELQTYDVGGLQAGTKYATRFSDQRTLPKVWIPSLAALTNLILAPSRQDCWLLIEIKSDPRHPEYTPALPEDVASILQPVLECDLQNRVILQSFDWRVVHECKRQAPTIPRSYLTHAEKISPSMSVNVYEGSAWMDKLKLTDFADSIPKLIAANAGQLWAPWHEDVISQDLALAQ